MNNKLEEALDWHLADMKSHISSIREEIRQLQMKADTTEREMFSLRDVIDKRKRAEEADTQNHD